MAHYYDSSSEDDYDIVHHFNNLSLSTSNRFPLKIQLNETLLNLNQVRNTLKGNTPNYIKVNDVLSYNVLSSRSKTFKYVKATFAEENLHVTSVQKVVNPYLTVAFEMKQKFDYDDIEPVELYHGTKEAYVDSICSFNFNWRLSGTEKGHKYGHGVNFTERPMFSTIFSEKGSEGVIIIADVLIDKVTEGSENLKLPPKGFNTTTGSGNKKHIFVKFNDHEFCPKFVVRYVK